MLNSLDRIYLATILPCHIFLVLTPIGCSTPQIPQVASATADVLDLTRVTNGEPAEFFPQPSPDGSQILFHVRDDTKTTLERWSIAMMNPQNTSERQLVAGPYAQSPAWLPDGSGFIYQYFKTDKPVLVKSSLRGFGISFLTQRAMGEDDGHPTVSHNGAQIVFHTKIGGAYHICSVRGDGSEFTVYVEGCAPDMHPSEDKVVFQRVVGNTFQIFVFDLKSGQVTQLTNGNYHSNNPSWSPDGRWITFASTKDGPHHIYIMSSNGAQITQLTSGGSEDGGPVWSTDGYIYFHSNAGGTPQGLFDQVSDLGYYRSVFQTPKETCGQGFNKWPHSDIWRMRPKLPQ